MDLGKTLVVTHSVVVKKLLYERPRERGIEIENSSIVPYNF